jgi:hypothetical protein
MIPATLIKVCLFLYLGYVLVGILMLIIQRFRSGKNDVEESKEFMAGLVFFPCLSISAAIIIWGWLLLRGTGSLGEFIADTMADGMHIFLLLPIVVLAALLASPVLWLLWKDRGA